MGNLAMLCYQTEVICWKKRQPLSLKVNAHQFKAMNHINLKTNELDFYQKLVCMFFMPPKKVKVELFFLFCIATLSIIYINYYTLNYSEMQNCV